MPIVLHRCPIAAPSIVHRFDGGMMDEQWGISGGHTEALRRNNDGKANL